MQYLRNAESESRVPSLVRAVPQCAQPGPVHRLCTGSQRKTGRDNTHCVASDQWWPWGDRGPREPLDVRETGTFAVKLKRDIDSLTVSSQIQRTALTCWRKGIRIRASHWQSKLSRERRGDRFLSSRANIDLVILLPPDLTSPWSASSMNILPAESDSRDNAPVKQRFVQLGWNIDCGSPEKETWLDVGEYLVTCDRREETGSRYSPLRLQHSQDIHLSAVKWRSVILWFSGTEKVK